MKRIRLVWRLALAVQLVLSSQVRSLGPSFSRACADHTQAVADSTKDSRNVGRRHALHHEDTLAMRNSPEKNELDTDDSFVVDLTSPKTYRKNGEKEGPARGGRIEYLLFESGREEDTGREDQVEESHAGGKHHGKNADADRNLNVELINAVLDGREGDDRRIEDFLNEKGRSGEQFNELLDELLRNGQERGRGGGEDQSDRDILQIIGSILSGNNEEIATPTVRLMCFSCFRVG